MNVIVKLLLKINSLPARRADSALDTSTLEGEIDRRVYELYGFTEEEIAIVEGK